MSTFGVMFAPDQQKAADEHLRALRPGGRVGINAWVPDGFVGDMFRTTGKHVPPPPAGVRPAFEWGTEARLKELFGDRIALLRPQRQTLQWRWPSGSYVVDYFRQWYGPTQNAFNGLDAAGKKALHDDLVALWEKANTATDGTLAVGADYLMTVAIKR